MSLRLAMLGTGQFALPTLQALMDSQHKLIALVTQPDRKGRGHHHHRNPLKELAVGCGVDVLQPDRINMPESVAALKDLQVDLFIVAAYGQILSADVLSVPRLGAINIHASLLPKYRGAAPIQYAVWNGESETGITIFQIEPKLDSGPVLAMQSTLIGEKETSGELEERLAALAVTVVMPVIDDLANGTAKPIPQNAAQATHAPRIKKAAGQIDWSKSARTIDCHVRAMQPWPKAFTYLDQHTGSLSRLILLEIAPVPVDSLDASAAPPGTVLASDSNHIVVATGDVPVAILRLQPEGKRAMTVGEFLCGRSIAAGDRFCAQSTR